MKFKTLFYNFIFIFSFTLIYIIFLSYENYKLKPEILPIYYPLGIICIIVIISLTNKWIFKLNVTPGIIIIFLSVILFFLIDFLVYFTFGDIIAHYYNNTSKTNLIGIVQYGKEKGNIVTIKKALLKNGITPLNIIEGNDKKFDINNAIRISLTEYEEVIYLVNNNTYIIFNWINNEVTLISPKEKIKCDIELKVSNNKVEQIWLQSRMITVKTLGEYSKNYYLIPENSQIKFVKVNTD